MIFRRPKAISPVALVFLCSSAVCLAQEAPSSTSGPSTGGSQTSGQPAAGQQQKPSAASAEDLQKATQNPVASLISVPIQNNSNFGVGPYDRIQNVLNIQPVIPMRLSENWNLILRWIAPIIWQPAPGTANLEVFGIVENTPAYFAAQDVQKNVGVFGFGDMTPTFFFAPAKSHNVIWGAGPVFVLPTANSKVLGQGKLSVGPSLVVLVQPGHWTVGALVNNAWSVAGSGGRTAVNQMTLQYFLNYNLKKGWFISLSPILTANWKASSGNVWTVPVGGGIGRVMRLGAQPVNISASFFGNAVHPSGGSPWGMRLQIAFLFPK
ncbi:MAG TPA: neuromedin U [Bryobacteraceae bacterium]